MAFPLKLCGLVCETCCLHSGMCASSLFSSLPSHTAWWNIILPPRLAHNHLTQYLLTYGGSAEHTETNK